MFARVLLLAGAIAMSMPYTYVTASAAGACSGAGTTLANCSFEAPALAAGAYKYNPTASSWTFTGSSGVAANASAFTGGQAAPDANQVAFIQNGGKVAQSVDGFAAGTYTLSFDAAQRANAGGTQELDVRVDGTSLGTLFPANTAYHVYSASFAATAGSHVISFTGLRCCDNTAFIDSISLSQTSAGECPDAGGTTLAQCGFEAPVLGTGNFTYKDFFGSAWTFTGYAGLAANNSAFTWGNPPAPEGSQVAFLQSDAQAAQTVGGFAADTDYTLTFSAAARANVGGQQDVRVLLDSQVLVDRLLVTNMAYQTFSATFQTSAGSHVLAFVGLNSAGGDNTAFIDDLHLFAKPTVKATTLQYSGDTQLYAGQSATLAGVLSDPAGQPVAGRTLQFVLGGSQSCSAVTDASGSAACTIAAVDQVAGVGDIPVRVNFAGDAKYLASSASAQVTVFHTTALAYTGAGAADFHDAFTASAVLTDVSYSPVVMNPVPNMPVTFALGGSSCQTWTDANGVAACSLTPVSPAGTWTLTAAVPTIGAWLGSTASAAVTVGREEAALSFVPPATALSGSVQLGGVLTEDGSTPIAGRVVTFTLGGRSCSATTNAAGFAICAVDTSSLALGPTSAGAAFAGDGYYNGASSAGSVLLYAFPSSGVFVIGDLADPNNINFYDSKWAQSNPMSGGPGPKNFKGFADSATALAPGGTFTATPGGSARPPQSVPSYMAVAVTSKVTDSNGVESGTIVRIGVVHVNVYVATVGGSGHGVRIS